MGILVLLSVSCYVDRYIIALLIAPMKADLNLTDTQFGAAQGLAFALTFCICAIPVGIAIDRYSRRLLIAAGVMIWSIGCIACGLAWDFNSLLLARMTVGGAEVVLLPGTMSLIGDLFPQRRRGLAVGVFGAAALASFLVSYAGGGALISFLDERGGLHLPSGEHLATWRAAFFIIGTPGFLLALLVLTIRDVRHSRSPAEIAKAQSSTEIFRNRSGVLIPYFVGIGSLVGIGAVVAQWAPAYMVRRFDIPVSEIGLWIGISYGLIAPFASIMTGIMLDRVYGSGVRTGPFWLAIIIAMFCGPVLIATFLQGHATAALIILSIGLVIHSSNAAINGACIQLIAAPEARGRISAIALLMTVGFGSGVAGFLVPLLSDYVIGSEAEIGTAIGIVVAGLSVMTVISFAIGLPRLRGLFHGQGSAVAAPERLA
ncbi:hypothetical protein A8G00_08675 [Sphingobium sp. SA916]|nr:hypothetical protein A8G00_08675 [Sphingobium sp. SA916]